MRCEWRGAGASGGVRGPAAARRRSPLAAGDAGPARGLPATAQRGAPGQTARRGTALQMAAADGRRGAAPRIVRPASLTRRTQPRPPPLSLCAPRACGSGCSEPLVLASSPPACALLAAIARSRRSAAQRRSRQNGIIFLSLRPPLAALPPTERGDAGTLQRVLRPARAAAAAAAALQHSPTPQPLAGADANGGGRQQREKCARRVQRASAGAAPPCVYYRGAAPVTACARRTLEPRALPVAVGRRRAPLASDARRPAGRASPMRARSSSRRL